MAAAEVAARPSERHNRRRPFTQWVKRLANLKGSDAPNNKKSGGGIPLTSSKQKKLLNGTAKNNPYPESGHLRAQSPASSANGHLSFSTPVSHPQNASSYSSLPRSVLAGEKEAPNNGNRSAAPTVATKPETVHSDTGHSKALTVTTNGGALSSMDGAGRDSTFSSPNQSEHSMTTTLTTIQSSNALQQYGASSNPLATGHAGPHPSNTSPNVFSHQYPVSPSPSQTASALPPHMAQQTSNPSTYSAATANGMLSDNASILTLASSSKRRRRSMDTDASVRAMAPSSVWGGSRESLPLSVLSGHAEGAQGIPYASQPRPSIGGVASAERASVYSSQGVTAPALASERNSYYSKPVKDLGDAKSLRSINNLTRGGDDARSLNADAKSFVGTDVASLRNYEGSIRSGALGHGRNDSVPGSIGNPLGSPGLRQVSAGGALSSRRSSDWQEVEEKEEEGKTGIEKAEGPAK